MPVALTIHYKGQTVLNNTTQKNRSFGWRERYFVNAADVGAAQAIVNVGKAGGASPGLVSLRALLLPATSYVEKTTLQKYEISPSAGEYPRGARVVNTGVRQVGPAANVTDDPRICLQCAFRLTGGKPQLIKTLVRNIPDFMTMRGEFIAADVFGEDAENLLRTSYRNAVKAFLAELETRFGTFVDERSTDAGKGRRIDTIANDGTVSYLGAALGAEEDTLVKITRATNSDGRQRGGIYRVTAVAANQILLAGWDHGEATGGTVRAWSRVFGVFAAGTGTPPTGGGQIVRATTRKIGTPRDYHGANKKSRK